MFRAVLPYHEVTKTLYGELSHVSPSDREIGVRQAY